MGKPEKLSLTPLETIENQIKEAEEELKKTTDPEEQQRLKDYIAYLKEQKKALLGAEENTSEKGKDKGSKRAIEAVEKKWPTIERILSILGGLGVACLILASFKSCMYDDKKNNDELISDGFLSESEEKRAENYENNFKTFKQVLGNTTFSNKTESEKKAIFDSMFDVNKSSFFTRNFSGTGELVFTERLEKDKFHILGDSNFLLLGDKTNFHFYTEGNSQLNFYAISSQGGQPQNIETLRKCRIYGTAKNNSVDIKTTNAGIINYLDTKGGPAIIYTEIATKF